MIHDRGMAEHYLANWHDHEAHSDQYTGRGEVAERTNDRQRRGEKNKACLKSRARYGSACLRIRHAGSSPSGSFSWAGWWAVS